MKPEPSAGEKIAKELEDEMGDVFPDLAADIDAAIRDSNAELFNALKRLVDLKAHKDAYGKNNWYVKNQKDAWEQAQQTIARHNACKEE